MTIQASSLIEAALLILTYKSTSLPILTENPRVIVEYIRLSSEILPVMCIIALSLVVFLVEWTPFCLEIEHVKVCILSHKVNNSCLDVTN